METKHPVEGYFGSEFWAICNHCGVMAAWSRKTWKFVEQFLRFLKRPLTVKFSTFCSKNFHRLTDRRCCVQISWNFADGKSAKSCVIYRQKHLAAYQTVANARIALKICQGHPPTMYSECSRCRPNRFTFGGFITQRVNTIMPRRVNPTFGGSIAE